MEKFGLLNLLKALENLSLPANKAENENKTAERDAASAGTDAASAQTPTGKEPAAAPAEAASDVRPTATADFLTRHEQIANRVKNKK